MEYIRSLIDQDTVMTAIVVIPAAYVWIFLESTIFAILIGASALAGVLYVQHRYFKGIEKITMDDLKVMAEDVRLLAQALLSRIRNTTA